MGNRLSLGSITLNVEQKGDGQPVIVFLHGITANRRVWDPIIERLSPRFTCVSVDQRGHGLSDKPDSGYSDLDYSSDIRLLAERLSPTAGIFVVGHSLGARNSIVAASRFPLSVRGVVAIDFVPFIEDFVFELLEKRVLEGHRSFSGLVELKNYLRGRYVHLPEDAIERRAQYGYEINEAGEYVPLAAAGAMAETVIGLREDLEPYLSTLETPAVIVRGELSTLVSPEAFSRARSLNSKVVGVVIPGADHYVAEEAPKEIAELIEDFVDNFAPEINRIPERN
jgi:2-(acetamidomethylene)succinate hydrolase